MNISQHLFNVFKVLVNVFQAGLNPLRPAFENKPESYPGFYFRIPSNQMCNLSGVIEVHMSESLKRVRDSDWNIEMFISSPYF